MSEVTNGTFEAGTPSEAERDVPQRDRDKKSRILPTYLDPTVAEYRSAHRVLIRLANDCIRIGSHSDCVRHLVRVSEEYDATTMLHVHKHRACINVFSDAMWNRVISSRPHTRPPGLAEKPMRSHLEVSAEILVGNDEGRGEGEPSRQEPP
jgi:hypothetical protein